MHSLVLLCTVISVFCVSVILYIQCLHVGMCTVMLKDVAVLK